MDVTKTYKFIGFGAMDVTKPYEFIGFGAPSGPASGRAGRNPSWRRLTTARAPSIGPKTGPGRTPAGAAGNQRPPTMSPNRVNL